MIDVNAILKKAEDVGASDVHFISGLKPIIRVYRELVTINEAEEISKDDIWDVYDYFLQGSVEKDKFFRENKVLDCSAIFNNIRLRVNISYADEVPVITTRLIRNELPTYEQLGVPDIVRRMTLQPQGLILVTGKTNSGKSTTLNALINYINETQNKKILTLDAAIETAESGHLVLGTLHTKSCAETIDRMINFYDVRDQASIKFLIASLLKLVVSQRLIRNKRGTLTLVPEVMVVDNIISGIIRKDKLSVSEMEDAIQSASGNGSIGLINSLAELFVNDQITLDQAKAQIEEKNVEVLNRTIMQLRIKRDNDSGTEGYRY